ncbi:hypothetical protein [Sulfolobus acidocaldarius]|nr:hypothetical protein [Sulfolobus acidocaldarius]
MGRRPCFMSDEKYQFIRNLSTVTGKSIYELTNYSIDLLEKVYEKIGIDNMNFFMEEIKFYVIIRDFIKIEFQKYDPKLIGISISNYLKSEGIVDSKRPEFIFILNIIAKLLDGKVVFLNLHGKDPELVNVMFNSEEQAKYFEQLFNIVASELNLKLRIIKDVLVVKIQEVS